MAQPDFRLRIMGDEASLTHALHERIPTTLADHVSQLMQTYRAFMHTDIVRIRLEVVRSKACWKWHRDYTTLRLISTLRGAGTQYLIDPANMETVSQLRAGDVGLFKGRLFADDQNTNGHHACVHRSPPWTETSAPRLLLVIDTPQDFEIEAEMTA